MFLIGCHLSISEGFVKTLENAISIGANTFQYFSRNPQGGKARPWNQDEFNNFLNLSKKVGVNQILTHAPYTLNLASEKDSVREFAVLCFKDDINRLENFPNALYNFHPGSCGKQSKEEGIDKIVDILNQIMFKDMKTTILLETMSGKGSEIGSTFNELKEIIDRVDYKDKIGVTMDTCHLYAAGYDIVNDLDGVLNEFDRLIGLERLKAIHLNDSKEPFNSKKDRHEKIGLGVIGAEAIIRIINHPKLKNIPFYLETPNLLSGYKDEIEFLKSKREI